MAIINTHTHRQFRCCGWGWYIWQMASVYLATVMCVSVIWLTASETDRMADFPNDAYELFPLYYHQLRCAVHTFKPLHSEFNVNFSEFGCGELWSYFRLLLNIKKILLISGEWQTVRCARYFHLSKRRLIKPVCSRELLQRGCLFSTTKLIFAQTRHITSANSYLKAFARPPFG